MATPAHFDVRLSPKAHANEIWGWEDGRLNVSVTAPNHDNEANDEMLDLLAKKLKIPRSYLYIYKGAKERNKTISVENYLESMLDKKLEAAHFPRT